MQSSCLYLDDMDEHVLIALIHLHLQVLQRVKTPNAKPKKTSDGEDRWVFLAALHDDHSRNNLHVLKCLLFNS